MTRIMHMAILAAVLFSPLGLAQETDAKRLATLEQLRHVLAESPEWEAWLGKSGELPPDFDAMPSMPLLPDPLLWNEGTADEKPLQSPEEWPARRAELLQQFQHWILGTVPPRPERVRAEVLSETEEAGAMVREVQLHFGPEEKAQLWLRLYIPKGKGPFPVFMTQENHNAWAVIALRGGYLACVYAGADSKDDTESFIEAYPEYDWSRLMRRAWAAGRCIDYLETVPEADHARIAISGHSRNGKQSLMASALDERIDAVISSSSGAGGPLPTRYCSEQHFEEGIENITRAFPTWFHPRWRFFVGREDKLPIDMHELVALSAPRPCLLSIAYNDSVESTWTMEQTYRAVKRVYGFLGAPDGALRILYRPAGHETWSTTIDRYIDWCDLQFGRGAYAFPARFIHPWDWDAWRAQAQSTPSPDSYPPLSFDGLLPPAGAGAEAWKQKCVETRAAVLAMLGTPPPGATSPGGTYGEEPDHIESQLGRLNAGEGLQKDDVVFGEYLNGDVYLPKSVDKTGSQGQRIPAVLWLHPAHNAHGYSASYKRGEQFYTTLAKEGYAVFCFDQIGYGRRIEEVEGFYERHPQWSLLGKMVRDVQSALDAIGRLPYVDQTKVYVVGYGLGSIVAEHLAALDERPAGYALVCGIEPYRLDTPDKRLGGIARWAKVQLLLPQLGLFEGQEDRIPYDRHLLIAAMAPRPVCVVSPTLDREVKAEDIARCVDSARPAFTVQGATDKLTLLTPEHYNCFDPKMHAVVIEWLNGLD